jgi:putative oxidoreductase
MIGGVALILGFLARPVAFILSGEMAVAYWQVHNSVSPYITAGAGAWSIDSSITRAMLGATR